MQNRRDGLHSLADRRYYHFVAVRRDDDFSLSAYWRRLGEVHKSESHSECVSERFVVQHRKISSSSVYARGDVARHLSKNGDGREPYFYDVFLCKLVVKDEHFLLAGFPFAGLAIHLLPRLVDGESKPKSGVWQGTSIPLLLSTLERTTVKRFEELHSHVVGVQFRVEDDKSLSALRLGGDDPLGASIYHNYVKERIALEEVVADNCVLACEVELSGKQAEASTLRSRVHVDGHGHFKFYAHVGCLNVLLLPYIVGQLRTWGALRNAVGNPLRRIGREDVD